MSLRNLLRVMLTAVMGVALLLPAFGTASAAIPCVELPVIEPDPKMPIPLIYIELPVSVEGVFARGQEADRTDAVPADENGVEVADAAMNQLRCMTYGDSATFAKNSTPQQRVQSFAVPGIDEDQVYFEADSVLVTSVGEPLALADGRFLVDFSMVVDSAQFLAGEMVFVQTDDGYYLDSSHLFQREELTGVVVTINTSQRFTREIVRVVIQNGDQVVFNNTEEEMGTTIEITDANGEVVFEGFDNPAKSVGGEAQRRFVAINLEPGEYNAVVTFSETDMKYGVVLVVEEQ